MKVLVRTLVFLVALPQIVFGQVPDSTRPWSFPLYLKVELDKSVQLSSLKPGDIAQGKLARDVYSRDRKIFAAGSLVRLRVDHLERRRKPANDRWPWIIRVFAPHSQTVPSFQEAAISLPAGIEKQMQVALISAGSRTEIAVQTAEDKQDASATTSAVTSSSNPVPHSWRSHSEPPSGPIMYLEANADFDEAAGAGSVPSYGSSSTLEMLSAGTVCRVLLLKRISASKSRPGAQVQARLLEPVVLNSRVVLPAGSVFEGSVVKVAPPRWLSRPGFLSLTFTGIRLAEGTYLPARASLSAVELDRRSHTKIDVEGHLHADRPGLAGMLINGGVTAGIAKEVDDSAQLLMEAALSGVTDASTAGTARLVGAVVSGIFFVTRHGRDVVLPDLAEMQITLDRPLIVPANDSWRLPIPH